MQGHADAQLCLGQLYESGRGIVKSDMEAERWFIMAAEQGNLEAQHNLGIFHKSKRAVAPSDVEAVRWWTLDTQLPRVVSGTCIQTAAE